jgi:hypothetical protein
MHNRPHMQNPEARFDAPASLQTHFPRLSAGQWYLGPAASCPPEGPAPGPAAASELAGGRTNSALLRAARLGCLTPRALASWTSATRPSTKDL